MFKYTCSKHLKHRFEAIRNEPYKMDRDWNFAKEILSGVNIPKVDLYHMTCLVGSELEHVVFYSPKPIQAVPIRGFMFPVSLFDCEEIE